MNADAFIHLPDLRARVTHPEQSLLRLTPEMFAMWEQRARAADLDERHVGFVVAGKIFSGRQVRRRFAAH